MLNHLSWNQFLLAAGTALLLYYPLVLLLCYRGQLKALLTKAASHSSGRDKRSGTLSVLGKAAPDDSPVFADPVDIRIAPPATATPPLGVLQPDEFQPEAMADLLAELSPLFDLVNQTAGSREDFCALAHLVISKYSPVLPERLQDHVNRYILEQTREKLPFELRPTDLELLWPKRPDGKAPIA